MQAWMHWVDANNPQQLVNCEIVPDQVSEWNLHASLYKYLLGINARHIVKLHVLKLVSNKRMYYLRCEDSDHRHEDAWVDIVVVQTLLTKDLIRHSADSSVPLYKIQSLDRCAGKFDIVEALAIICVLCVFATVYLTKR